MSHIMIDLETMSVDSNAAIVSIGAVEIDFKNNRLGEQFYSVVDLDSAMKSGGIVDGKTILWWLKQNNSAKLEFTSNAVDVKESCLNFIDFINYVSSPKQVKIWGDGAAFDNVILSNTFKRLNLETPWNYWNDRCYRTIKNTFKEIKADSFGVAHNALDDAKGQALHLLKIYQLRNKGDIL